MAAQKQAQEDTRQNTLRLTATGYYELKRTLALVDIAQQQLAQAEAQLAINKDRLEAGVGTRTEILQTEAQVARANQSLLEAVNQSKLAALRLNEILNVPAFVAVAATDDRQQMQTLVPAKTDFNTLLATATQNSPALQVVQQRIAALKALKPLVFSAFLPEVSIQYRLGAVGATIDDQFGYREGNYSLNFGLPNLGVTAITRYKENQAQIDQLSHQYQAQVKALERQLAESYTQANTAQAMISVAQAEVKASEQVLADAMDRLQVGVGRNIDVIDAQTDLVEARTHLNTGIMTYNQAQVNLVYYLGMASPETLTQGVKLP